MSENVFNRESSWGNRQLNILKSIEHSFKDSLSASQKIYSSLSKLEYAMTYIARELVSNVDDFNRGLDSLDTELRFSSDSLRRFSRQAGESTEELSKFRKALGTAGTVLNNLWDHLGKLDGIGREVNKFSTISNQMLQISGVSGDSVREFRSEIVGTVRELNSITGGAYSPQDSYERMVSISKGVTSNLESLQEMARPLLLAEQALNINTEEVADLFNLFYTRYKFSSENMEDALDAIRGNTAGNSANAEATLKNINELESWISNYAGDDNELRERLMESISNYTSWLESMGVTSGPFTEYLKAAAYGDWSDNKELIHILSKTGIDATEATNMARSGQYEELTHSMMQGIYEIMKQFDSNGDKVIGENEAYALGRALDNYGISRELAMDVWNVMNSEGFTGLEEFIDNLPLDTSMTDTVDDKYYSLEEQANHWLERIYSRLANIQEGLGFGVSDIALASLLLRGVEVPEVVSRLFRNIIGNAGTSTSSGSGILGGLARSAGSTGAGAAAIGGLGAAAGVGLGAYGITQAVQDFREGDTGYGIANSIGGAAGAAGAVALMLGAGPVGWIALAGSAAVLAGTALAKELAPLSGAAESVAKEFEDLNDSLNDTAVGRIQDLNQLKDAILDTANTTEGFDESLRLAQESGLLDFNNTVIESKDDLLAFIDATVTATEGLIEMNTAALDAASHIAQEEAKKQTGEIQNELFEDLMSRADNKNNISYKNDPTNYLLVDALFEQLAASITDEEARAAFEDDWERARKNQKYSEAELKILTGMDTAPIRWKMSRQNSVFGQNFDFDLFNSALSLLGIGGYDMSESDNAQELSSIYNKWFMATDSSEKSEYRDAFEELYSNMSEAVRSPFDEYAEEMGISSYAVGSNYISHDQLAYLHEGEAVVPKKYNPAANNKELIRAMNSLDNSQQDIKRENQETKEYFISFIEEVKEIREFLEEWKTDGDRKEKLAEMKSTLKSASKTAVNGYMAISY